jgi:CMP-N-acetylneuraminic acid synthetase
MNVIIITAKGGNTSLTNKNLINVNGFPVLSYVINAARNSSRCNKIYITTECDSIKHLAKLFNIDIIDRPLELSQSSSLHRDVIEHAVKSVKSLNSDLNNVVVLLGNTVMIDSKLIDLAFLNLKIMTVIQ